MDTKKTSSGYAHNWGGPTAFCAHNRGLARTRKVSRQQARVGVGEQQWGELRHRLNIDIIIDNDIFIDIDIYTDLVPARHVLLYKGGKLRWNGRGSGGWRGGEEMEGRWSSQFPPSNGRRTRIRTNLRTESRKCCPASLLF